MDNDKFQELVIKQLAALTESQESLTHTVSSMNVRMGALEKGQDLIAGHVNSLTVDVKETRQSQVRMENELTDKVRALFDAREVTLDYFASIKNDLARLAEGQDQVKRLICHLDTKQEEQERELRLIRLERK